MVWTEHQFSAYELVAPGPVSEMTIVLDERESPVPKATGSSEASEKAAAEQQQRITDSIVGSTLLGATPVVAHGLHPAKDFVSVAINEVVRDKNAIYVRFAVTNNSPHPYRILSPTVLAITPQRNANLVPAMKGLQISDQVLTQFQSVQTDTVTVRSYSVSNRDVDPGKTVEGVLTFQSKEVDMPGVSGHDLGSCPDSGPTTWMGQTLGRPRNASFRDQINRKAAQPVPALVMLAGHSRQARLAVCHGSRRD